MANSRLSSELFDIRYAPNWCDVRRLALSQTRGKCCLCESDAAEVHHAMYKDSRGAILGSELPGVHIFPLCKSCHKKAHGRRNWVHNWKEPLFGNRNTDAFLKELRAGYLSKLL